MSAIARTLARKSFDTLTALIPSRVRDRLLVHYLRRVSDEEKLSNGVPTVAGVLENVKRNGFSPRTVIDIGAYIGDWSRMAARFFPSARIILIEGNPQRELALRKAQAELGPNCDFAIQLLGSEEKEDVSFYQLETGSSVLPELTTFERKKVSLPMRTLDQFLSNRGWQPPLLLKLDVQGFELEVLRGGGRTLSAAELVILETSLLPYNEGAPLFAEVIGFMDRAGFAVYDFCGQSRRETDNALYQTDVVFARKESALRVSRRFWLNEPDPQ